MQSVANASFAGVAVVLFCAMVWFGVQRLKYVEFGVATSMLLKGEFHRILQAKIRLEVLESAMTQKRDLGYLWSALRDTCKDLGFSYVSLRYRGHEYEESFAELESPEDWSIHIDLSAVDSITVRHSLNSPLQAMLAVPFMETIHRHFSAVDPATLTTRNSADVPSVVQSQSAPVL
jgi:hypothetical protein